MKYTFVVTLTVFFAFTAIQMSHAQNIFQKLLPSIFPYDNSPKPEDTLIAPFADPELLQNSRALPKGVLPENATAIDQPHRQSKDIETWVLNEAATALSFKAGNIDASVQGKKIAFSRDGWPQYQAYLVSSKILNSVKNGQYNVHGFSNERPLLLNEGVVNGSYKWLYDVPMTVSFLKTGMKDYDKSDAVNMHLLLRIQVGRDAKAPNSEGLLIDQWSGKEVQK